MPFTGSHPALILPLALLPKRYISLTGLIIGSIAPDFEYFIRLGVNSEYSHTFWGLFYFNLPLGILLAFLFHGIVKEPLFNSLPSFLQRRFSTFQNFNWNKHFRSNWLTVVISILVGSASHLAWDSFTHYNGSMVQALPFLQNDVTLAGYSILLYKVMQHSSTVLGGLIILLIVFRLKPSGTFVEIKRLYWIVLVSSFFYLIIMTYIIKYEFISIPFWKGDVSPTFSIAIVEGIVISISCLLLAMVIASMIWRYKQKR